MGSAPQTERSIPPGLHVHILPGQEASLRFVLWLEGYADPRAFHEQKLSKYEREHPGCLADRSWAQALGLVGARQCAFWVHLPRLGNGYPLALPGPMRAWDMTGFRTQGRVINHDWYRVSGWIVPLEYSLAPLAALLGDWKKAFGEAYVAPQTNGVITFIEALTSALAEGPLLPTVLPESDDERALRGPSVAPRLGWVPPLSIDDVQQLWVCMKNLPELRARSEAVFHPCYNRWGEGTDRPVDLDERYPTRFVRFLLELLAGATGSDGRQAQDAGGPWSDELVRQALIDDAPVLRELHRAYGSCLYPHHPIFDPPKIPPHHLHGEIDVAELSGESTAPYVMRLGLTDDKSEEVLTIEELEEDGRLGDTLVEKHGRLWFRAASVVFRDWSLRATVRPALFARPELLAQGKAFLSSDEASALLEAEPAVGNGYELQRFLEHEGEARASYRKKGFVSFTAAAAKTSAIKVRVQWAPVATQESLGDDLWALQRFAPEISLVLDGATFDLAEAERLLVESTAPLLRLGDRALPRVMVASAVELGRAREKVLRKLGSGGLLTWSQLASAEDEWAAELDEAAYESVFAKQWQSFLTALEGGSGVPALATPAEFAGQLRPYQARGLSWLAFLVRYGLGGCLADDMGLGKTIQVLALLLARDRSAGPTLVVAPTSVVDNWAREAARFTPTLTVYVHQGHGRVRDHAALGKRIDGAALTVTSYAILRQDRELLTPVPWGLVVVDEAQNIKNPAAQQTQTVKALTARARLVLTGTPVENHLGDLWSLFDFVLPGLLGGPTRFARAFSTPIRGGSSVALTRLRTRVQPFLLRRTKKDPEIVADLPDKQEQIVDCRLVSEQVALYHAMVEAVLSGLVDTDGMERKAHVLRALLHLKQICNHPESFEADKPEALAGRSGKLDRLLDLMAELLEEDQAALVFTQFVQMGEILRRAICERFGFAPPFLHGGLSPEERTAIVDAFQAADGPPVLLLSLKAGGTGLNLTRASVVIHYDRWWNPAVEDQATDRAHRIGQTRKVHVYKLVTRGTLEERIHQLIEHKRELAERLLAASDESWLTEMSNDELRAFLALDDLSTIEDSPLATPRQRRASIFTAVPESRP